MTPPKKIKTLAGTTAPPATAGDNPAVPLNPQQMYEALVQLQNTVNELIVNFNAHTHGGVTVGAAQTGVTASLVDGNGEAASNLFTAN